MADPCLKRIQALVARKQWSLSQHLMGYIEDGEFDEEDVEDSIKSGRIDQRHRDETNMAVDKKKYSIIGKTRCGIPLETVGKIIEGTNGKEYFVITGYIRRGSHEND